MWRGFFEIHWLSAIDVLFGCLLVLLTGFSLGCDSSPTDDDDSLDDDAGDDDTSGDDDAGDDDTAGDDDALLGEVASFVYSQSCVGCEDLVLFGNPPLTELELISIDLCFSTELAPLFAGERIDAAVRALEVGTCEVFDASVFEIPSCTCLDAGPIDIQASWAGWAWYPLDYSPYANGYPSQIAWGDNIAQYAPGLDVTLSAGGGADIGSFSILRSSVTPLRLLSPQVEGDQVINHSFDEPLEVTWSGGELETTRVYLLGQWFSEPGEKSLLGCHTENDGEHVIPTELLAQFDPGQFTQLWLSERRLHDLDLDEIENAGWTLGSSSFTYVYYDPDAVP